MDTVIGILTLLVLGLIVGALAKFITPGRDPGGIVTTSILGVVGAILGGWIASFLEIGGITGLDWRSLVTALGGSLLLLLAYRAFRMLTTHETAPSYFAGHAGIDSTARAQATHTERDATHTARELIESAGEALNANALQKLAGNLGESTSSVRRAMDAMVPTILAGMSNQASTIAGASRLFDMAKDAAQGGSDLIGRLDHHVGPEGLETLTRKGGNVLSALFGDKLNGLLSWFTRFSGVKESSATSLMGVATNLVLGILGKNILQKGLTASTFGRMLSSMGGPLSRMLPSGLTDVPGMHALADLGDRASVAVDDAYDAGHRVVTGGREAVRHAADAVRPIPWLAALAPLLLLALPLLAFAFAMRGAADLARRAEPIPVNLPQVNVPKVTLPQVRVPEVRTAEIPKPINQPPLVPTTFEEKLVEVKLPGDKILKLPASSFLYDVYRYLVDATAKEGRAFTFDGLDFDAATIKSRPETEAAVTQLTTLLTAYPNVMLRIDSHTERSVDPAADKRLSLERAEALKTMLVKAGVPADRIKISDLGSTKPLASELTAGGRARNDRIELWLEKV
jgi:outer membrane protein OmpA-like peptidoglycan-associated protein/uncharacterized membrane protein YeaQ/YmgE (transglycosylase-associated protein family)